MTSKKIEPTDRMIRDVETWGEIMGADDLDLLRYILNHPDAAGLLAAEWKANAEAAAERAERAEDRLADSVHVDEAARRVEAAREEGWDQATLWIDSYQGGPNGRTSSARAANPYRPVQEPPAEYDGAVLVPADGHKAITTTKGQEFARLTFTTKQDLWYGPNLAARPGDWVIQTTVGDRLTPGTWRAV